MKKLSLIVCILSLFCFTNAFALQSESTPPGADICADEGGKTAGSISSPSGESPASPGGEVTPE